MRAIVIAHAGPLVLPMLLASVAYVVIAIPCHDTFSVIVLAAGCKIETSAKTIATASDKVDKSVIAKLLKLLTDFRPDILVMGI